MPPPIGFCPQHGLFPVTIFGIGDGASVTLVDVGTDCPRCGAMVQIVPGTYEVVGDRLSLLLDSSIAPDALKAIGALVERVQRQEIDLDDARRAAEKIAPAAGRLFDIANWSDQAKATLYASIIGAVAVIAAAKLSGGSTTINNYQPVVERVIEKSEERWLTGTSLSRVPTPIPRPKEPPKGRQ